MENKKNNRRYINAVALLLIGSMLLCTLFLAACSTARPSGSEEGKTSTGGADISDEAMIPDDSEDPGEDTISSEYDHDDSHQSDSHHEDSHHEDSHESSSGSGTGFIRSMGCDDVNCTSTKHYHHCPADCADYDHYHHCDVDCTVVSHNHHRYTNPVESDKKS